MARRTDPERIFQARRDAIRNTLTGSGMSLETAKRWCDAWDLEAARAGAGRAVSGRGVALIASERAVDRAGQVAS